MCPSVADISVGVERLADSPNYLVSADNGASYFRFYNGTLSRKRLALASALTGYIVIRLLSISR